MHKTFIPRGKTPDFSPKLFIYLVALTFFFVGFLLVGSPTVFAQYACNPPPDYCIGTASLSQPRGCKKVGNYCSTTHATNPVSCGADCTYSVQNYSGLRCKENAVPPNCDVDIDDTYFSASGTCCVNAGDDDDDDDDPPGDPTKCGTRCGEGKKTAVGVDVAWENHSICHSANLSCGSWHNCSNEGDDCFKVCWKTAVCSSNPPPVNYPICGNIVGSDGIPMRDVGVSISTTTSNGTQEIIVTTDNQGRYATPNGFLMSDDHATYSVIPQGD